ncbi:LA2681 family HEPN domain-containing protein [Enterococcus malodoratus]|uniref:LA2681 family HEPN domain-containing protein n=1 Tax=Enterococcus malodoratus TaxID=71451 RepID=UPI0039B0EBC3
MWWNDKQLQKFQQDCDMAYDTCNSELLLELSEKGYDFGHRESFEKMLRANYLYCAATSLSGLIEISFENLKGDIIEKYYEKCIYLFRTARDCCKNEYKSILSLEDNNSISKMNVNQLYYRIIVNYSNLLSQSGRYIKSIESLNELSNEAFPMVTGILALKISDYSYYDISHRKIMLYQAFQMLSKVLDDQVKFPEKEYAQEQFITYSERILKALGEDYLSQQYSLTDFLDSHDDMDDEEINYRTWFSQKGLALNQLNDIFLDMQVGYDPLHLPSLTEPIDSPIIPRYHGLFNQIKQEYVSARFWIYEGLTDKSTHFSDKDVYLVNTLDYPIYGIGIEKIKAAYREIYSIFDKIAYFLNKYLDLGIPDHLISFHNLWYKKSKGKKSRRQEILSLQRHNYNLNGLWWIYKDLKNISVYENKHIDPILEKISKVRNAMEHRYLKVLDYFDSDAPQNDNRTDDFAYIISFESFEKLTIELLKLTREAIMQLTMIVQTEEDKRERSSKESVDFVQPISLSEFDDEWKQIW